MDNRFNDLRQLVDLESDGTLDSTKMASLEPELESSSDLRQELQQLTRLNELLRGSRATVRDGFSTQVMAALPSNPSWANAQPLGWVRWRVPLVAMFLMAVAAATLLSLDPAGLNAAASAGGLMAAIGGLISSTLIAGAGLIGASWRGVGLALGEALTLPEQLVFGFGIVCLNVVLFRMVRSGRRVAATERSGDSASEE